MIVKQLADIIGTTEDVKGNTWTSRRLLLAKEQVGFSLHDTIMKAGTETTMWYKNHIEAVYCIEGEGELEDLVNGKTYQLAPGTLYVLNGNERHIVRPKTDVRMVCVFNPPVTGRETHDEEGAYPLLTE
ncbi:ectoine synthase [Alicyclobacillus ferrooxydans]|uniref:L-ectoine synthase n=1 Tax=Alicyclobacillus ferrooxydans TaxID=471514 RepID=A0A0N8PPK6_9BACL|nr:ectoine synthase [Alicyclobacillus ferrooxydans]KPV44589.1 L-ectoine synthase [Alicyclobacillus ferrooxydans]